MIRIYILVCLIAWYRLAIQNYYPSGIVSEIINNTMGRFGLIILWPIVVIEQIINLINKSA